MSLGEFFLPVGEDGSVPYPGNGGKKLSPGNILIQWNVERWSQMGWQTILVQVLVKFGKM